MDAAIIQSGRFTSTGVAKTLQIRSDFDWIQVYNETAIAQNAADLGAVFYWQSGMTSGRGLVTTKLGAVANDPTTIGQIAELAGFTPVDSSGIPLSAAVATTNVTNATRPVISTGGTAGLTASSIVRVYSNVNTRQINGYDFAIDTIVANTSFRIASVLATATDGVVAQAGNYRIVNFDPLYYPRHRFPVNITQAASAVVTLSVPSGYKVGQTVRFSIPSQFGMVELDNQIGTITAVDDTVGTQTITVNIDTTGYTAFTFPLNAAYPFTRAIVVPVGENTAQAISSGVDILNDATYNTGYIGVILAAGTASPAGQNGDAIYWVAGKSSYTQNP